MAAYTEDAREQALIALMQAYGDSVKRMCCMYLRELGAGEDAAQDTFIKAYEHIDQILSGEVRNEKAWLMRIAVNTCKTTLRSPEYRLYAHSPDMDELPEPSIEDDRPDATVLSAVMALPDKYREVVMLHYYQGLPGPEVARILRVPQATVLTRLHRARKLLESELKGWYLGDE